MEIKFKDNEIENIKKYYKEKMKHVLLPDNCEGANYSISFQVLDTDKADYFLSMLMYDLTPEEIENIGLKVTAFSLFDYTERDRILKEFQDKVDELSGRHYDYSL